MNNIQHFLLENEANIESIPSLLERIEVLEGPWRGTPDVQDTPAVEDFAFVFLTDGFDQRDHDELFADGGATKGSFDPNDWGELFSVPIAADPTRTHADI